MSYREKPQSAWLGPLPKISWTLVALGAAFIVLVTFDQVREALVSKSYGIGVGWLSLALTLVVFLIFEAAAFLAAKTGRHGISIWFGSFVVAPLGMVLLFELAQVGM